MIDALLFSVRDTIRGVGYGYGYQDVELTDTDGKPPARMGNLFISVYELSSRSSAVRNLDEYFSFGITLTMRATAVPRDRVGDQLIASKLARKAGKGNPSFNARLEQLRGLLHMNWQMTCLTGQSPASANDNIAAWSAGTPVYGFVEPAHYSGMDKPSLVWQDWFTADPQDGDAVGIKAEARFDSARRMQPQTASVGPFF